MQFGFFRGASLRDPDALLEGKRRYVRHVKLWRAAGIDEDALAGLLRDAVERT